MSARAATAACAALVVASGAVRLLPCWNDFWLDEVWSYFAARQLGSALEVFTHIHHSNNNHLNTLFLYFCGDRAQWAIYRLPSAVAGTASVALAAALAWRRDRLEAVLAALLTGACFALVHFSSEARGYATAVGLALAALFALERELERPRASLALLFGACTALGLLSHLSFAFFWAGALAWSALRLWRDQPTPGGAWRRFARLHALPALGLALLFAVDLRHLQVGGGNPTDLAELVARSVGFSLGLPVVRALALPYALLAAALVGGGVALLVREGDDRWVLYAVAIVAAPLVVLGVARPQVVAVRYFLIGIALALLLAARLLARAWRGGPALRAAAALALAVFLLGNAAHTAAFLRLGRGGYRDALLYMASESRGAEIVVGSDHDFRIGAVLRFYTRALPAGKELVYLSREQRAAREPEWLVVHRAQRPAVVAPALTDRHGRRYALAAEFDHAAISGFYWAVYRRSEASPEARRRSSTTPKPSPRKGSAPIRSTRS